MCRCFIFLHKVITVYDDRIANGAIGWRLVFMEVGLENDTETSLVTDKITWRYRHAP